jgi:ribosomal protein S18 acetylase RimI-like enzyme
METTPAVAGEADAARLTRLLTDAFHADEIWGAWAFPQPATRRERRRAMFGLFVEGALRYPCSWLAAGETAATLWIPPGGSDLSAEQEAAVAALLGAGSDVAVDRVEHAFEVFDKLRPSQPHYYLSLFGADPGQAGRGHGQRLLAHNLARLDADGAAAYLDTSDSLVPLYRRHGFEVVDAVRLHDGPRVNGMWRDARSVS